MENPVSYFIQYDRIRKRTSPSVNHEIDRATESSISRASSAGKEAISERIATLDHEWDIDRALMVNFVALGGLAFLGGILGRRRMFAALSAQMGFLLLHAFHGWCPPTPVLRRLGFRTRQEIDAEKAALQMAQRRRSPPRRQASSKQAADSGDQVA